MPGDCEDTGESLAASSQSPETALTHISKSAQFECYMLDRYLIAGLQRNVSQGGAVRPNLGE